LGGAWRADRDPDRRSHGPHERWDSVAILNLDDQVTQLQLTQGALHVRVRHLESNQLFEVDTPNVAFTLRQPANTGSKWIPTAFATTIVVRRGQGEVYGEDTAFLIDSRQSYRFMGSGLREYQQALRRASTHSIAGRVTAIAATTRRLPPATYRRTWSATRTSMRMAAGTSTRPTAMFGIRIESPSAGRLTATAIGMDRPLGLDWVDDAPGLRRVALRPLDEPPRMWGWIPGPVRTAPTTPRHWLCSSVARTFSYPLPPAPSVESHGFRLDRARSTSRPIR